MKASAFSLKGGLAVRQPSVTERTAFTVVELLVVIVTLAVLAAMLLPALAGTQSQSKVTACNARFRQWSASANLYANDNRGWLPSSDHAEEANMPGTLEHYMQRASIHTAWMCPIGFVRCGQPRWMP